VDAQLRRFKASLLALDMAALREVEAKVRRRRRVDPADPLAVKQLAAVQLRKQQLKPRSTGWFW
jgi:hypothetical protein